MITLGFKEVLRDDLSGESGGSGAEFSAGVERRVDAGVDAGPYNGSEFPAAGIDELSGDGGAVVRAIVTKVRSDRSSSEIYFFTKDAVANVAEMADGCAWEEDGVFHFDRLADMATIADGRGTAEVAIRAYLAVFPNGDRAFNKDSRENFSALSDNDLGIFTELDRGMTRPVGDARHELFIKIEKLPWELDLEGFAEFRLPLGKGATGDKEFVV